MDRTLWRNRVALLAFGNRFVCPSPRIIRGGWDNWDGSEILSVLIGLQESVT
jgi:hypothetical protein